MNSVLEMPKPGTALAPKNTLDNRTCRPAFCTVSNKPTGKQKHNPPQKRFMCVTDRLVKTLVLPGRETDGW